MNRQFRRAQEKQDKKQEKEKAKRREERRSRLRRLRRGRSSNDTKRAAGSPKAAADSGEKGEKGEKGAGTRGRLPGRFSGVLAAVTVFFISLQGVAPVEQEPALSESLIGAGFYLMLGYFATLWFMRRQVVRPLLVSVIGGTLLAAAVAITSLVQGRALDPLMLALVVPALIAGALLGRLVFRASPR